MSICITASHRHILDINLNHDTYIKYSFEALIYELDPDSSLCEVAYQKPETADSLPLTAVLMLLSRPGCAIDLTQTARRSHPCKNMLWMEMSSNAPCHVCCVSSPRPPSSIYQECLHKGVICNIRSGLWR